MVSSFLLIFGRFRMGSALRGRRKGAQQRKAAGRDRITPAWAGKRAARKHTPRRYRDHPRVYGEKVGLSLRCDPIIGSPPRMRGKILYHARAFREDRITPACAGKSRSGAPSARHQQDHPRVCGEKCRCPSVAYIAQGSPPRVRGKGRWPSKTSCW